MARLREAGAALIVTGTDRRIVAWEACAERIFGHSPEEAIGRTSDEIGIARRDVALRIQEVLFERPDCPVEQNMTLKRKDGTRFPAFVRLALAFDSEGAYAGNSVLVFDTSHATRADSEVPGPSSLSPIVELAARALSGTARGEMLAACTRLAADALDIDIVAVAADSSGRGMRVVGEVGLGEEMVGTGLAPADQALLPRLRHAAGSIVAYDRVPPDSFIARHGGVSGLMTSIGDPANETGALLVFSRTPRTFSEQERDFVRAVGVVLSGAAELERAHELERRFHRASRLEAMGQLTGGIAHDFNNLLAVILNYASFAREDIRAGGDPENSVAEIEKAARQATGLTRQLLVFSRQEAVAREPIYLSSAIEDLRGLLALTLGEQIELVIKVQTGLQPVEMGAGQLEQVLVNLAVNARDAMPDGGTFSVVLERISVDSGHLRLRIADTGAGMTPDVREKAFEPFFTTKPVGEGSGFGLATVYGIITGNGGVIDVSSEIGRGTEFEILLPMVEDEPQAQGSDSAVNIEVTREGCRILLVEDDDMVRKLTARILKEGGCGITQAATPSEAIAEVRSAVEQDAGGPFDLLVTDVVMPELSGVELAMRVRQLLPEIRVVFMSGYTGESVRGEAVYEVDASFVEKPFTPEALFGAVDRALGRG
jgi:two-component system cell cycle sensor histidine kinase/response regulator CckA